MNLSRARSVASGFPTAPDLVNVLVVNIVAVVLVVIVSVVVNVLVIVERRVESVD